MAAWKIYKGLLIGDNNTATAQILKLDWVNPLHVHSNWCLISVAP
jgi:hypothetical protein